MINLQAMNISLVESVTILGSLILVISTSIFLLAQIKKDNSIMDIAYGPTFLLTSLGALFIFEKTQTIQLSSLIVLAIALWSLRLALRIYHKNKGLPEDVRYATWRTRWEEKGHWYFLLRSYLQIYLLQGAIILIVLLPLSISLTNSSPLTFSWFIMTGLIIFITGLAIESLADYQLDQFIARKKANKESATIMQTGLFRFSRRPNYFGETLIWWGLAIMVLPLPYGFLAIMSPLTITYIVTRITGPMLEKIFISKYGDTYKVYMRKTSYFIPLPPRRDNN